MLDWRCAVTLKAREEDWEKLEGSGKIHDERGEKNKFDEIKNGLFYHRVSGLHNL